MLTVKQLRERAFAVCDPETTPRSEIWKLKKQGLVELLETARTTTTTKEGGGRNRGRSSSSSSSSRTSSSPGRSSASPSFRSSPSSSSSSSGRRFSPSSSSFSPSVKTATTGVIRRSSSSVASPVRHVSSSSALTTGHQQQHAGRNYLHHRRGYDRGWTHRFRNYSSFPSSWLWLSSTLGEQVLSWQWFTQCQLSLLALVGITTFDYPSYIPRWLLENAIYQLHLSGYDFFNCF